MHGSHSDIAPVTHSYDPVPRRRQLVNRKDGRSLHRTTMYLPPELTKRLSMRSVETEQTKSEIVCAALRAYL